MVETLPQTYTSQAEIERIWSSAAALLRTDDNQDGQPEAGVWDDIVAEATDAVNFCCEKWYEPADMANNLWIRGAATRIGAYLLSQRRGDPGQYTSQYERVIADLEQVESGKKQVPRLAQRADFTPAMSNLRVDHRFATKKIRVQQQISTGGTSARQDADPVYLDE
ncbi:MAG TPA: phage protein Gp36 family protein [Thermoguttaceae bacterium]|nr:phage protein Gp36 family protein [Thermoguttaceae bacterium]